MEHKYITLKLGALHGVIKHYYHFFYGVLIPLIIFYDDNVQKYNKLTLLINDDLGPMLRLLLELPIDIKYRSDIKDNEEPYYLKPMDIHPTYQKKDLEKIKRDFGQFYTYEYKKQFNNWFINTIKIYNLYIKPIKYYDIIIIERKTNPAFSSTRFFNSNDDNLDKIMSKSGSERRGILNHNELVKFIKKKFPLNSCINISLEFIPLFEQFHLFRKAKLLIGQHGAALANMAFMKKNTQIIEIVSSVMLDAGENWFRPISTISKINHLQYITNTPNVKLITDTDNATIDLDDFNNFLITNNVKIV